jgi:hypothetical protein
VAKAKSKTVEVSGVILKADLRSERDQFSANRYSPGTEYFAVSLTVTLRGDDGEKYYFKTTPAKYWVTTSGPVSVACVMPNDWVTKEGWSCEGFAGARGIGKSPIARVKAGDRVSIKGRVKGEKDLAWGVPLSHVKRTDYSFDAEKAAYQARVDAATRTLAELPGDAVPPVIPGVEWVHGGGYPDACDVDRTHQWYPSDLGNGHAWLSWAPRVKDEAALVAHVEGVDPDSVKEPV